MLDDNLIIYPHLDLALPTIPTRSRFYQLEPIGIGTPLVESLTGYIVRLAESHCISTRTLLSKELDPFLKKEGVSRKIIGLARIHFSDELLNSTGVIASDWVQALEAATLQNDLHLLTLLSWSNVLTSVGLLRRYRAWCPICYREWHESDQEVYEPLLWSLSDVKICLKHHTPLCNQCSKCNKNLHLIDYKSRVGYCSRCEQWLGTTSEEHEISNGLLSRNDFKFQVWVANNIGALIATTPYLQSFPRKDWVATAISKCVEQAAEGNRAAFARRIQRPKTTVWLWQAGEILPPLQALLQICYLFQIPLLSFLTEKIEIKDLGEAITSHQEKNSKRSKRTPKRFDSPKVLSMLEAELLKHTLPIRSMEQVALSLGYQARDLRRHFPELCHTISKRYAGYRKHRCKEKLEKLRLEVRQNALRLHTEGVYPTQARVSAQMSQPGCFRDEQARDELRKVQNELKAKQPCSSS